MITATDKVRDVRGSLVRAKRKRSEEIISITPALTTDGGNPVKAIYNIVKKMEAIVRDFLPSPRKCISFPTADVKMARCIPLNARM